MLTIPAEEDESSTLDTPAPRAPLSRGERRPLSDSEDE